MKRRHNFMQKRLDIFSNIAERNDKIITLWKQKMIQKEIARVLDIPVHIVNYVVARHKDHLRALEYASKNQDQSLHRLPCGLDDRERVTCSSVKCYLNHKCRVYKGPDRREFSTKETLAQARQFGYF